MYSITDCGIHGLALTSNVSSTSIGDLAAGKMLIVPEEFTSGVKFFRKNGRMDELMDFLARYVRLVHANRYYKRLLVKNCDSSYLDIITASDVAYVLSLMMNNVDVWLKRKTPDGKIVKPLYTSGTGVKRVYGVTTWNKSGMKYYRNMMNKWKPAFTRGHKDFRTLRRHWDKWIESSNGGRKVALANGDTTKTAYTILRTRSEVDACMPSDDDDDDDDVDESEEFNYESDEDEIILSNWDGRKSINSARVNNYSDDNGDEEYDSGSDEDSSDDDGGGRGENDGGDDESGDYEDDGVDVGHGKNDSDGNEMGDDDDGMNNEGMEDEEEESDDEVGRGRRLNGLGRMLEEEAVAAGMREHITNKSNNKRKGGKGLPQSEEREERPKHTRRVTAVNND